MLLTVEQFAFRVVQNVTALKHAYKSTIYGAIQALRINYGFQCAASDDEIYAIVERTLFALNETVEG